MSEEGIEELRRRKVHELQQRSAEEQRHDQVRKQVEGQKQALLRRILTSEARQRITNLRMIKPEFVDQLELQLIQLAQSGRIKIPVTDEQLKDILAGLQSQRREIKIRRL